MFIEHNDFESPRTQAGTGKALVELHVARLLEVGCTSIAVLLRPEAADALHALLRAHPQVCVEAVSTSSQAESLAAGLRVLDAADATRDDDVVIVTPVDMLPASATTHRGGVRSWRGSLNLAPLASPPRYADAPPVGQVRGQMHREFFVLEKVTYTGGLEL